MFLLQILSKMEVKCKGQYSGEGVTAGKYYIRRHIIHKGNDCIFTAINNKVSLMWCNSNCHSLRISTSARLQTCKTLHNTSSSVNVRQQENWSVYHKMTCIVHIMRVISIQRRVIRGKCNHKLLYNHTSTLNACDNELSEVPIQETQHECLTRSEHMLCGAATFASSLPSA